MDTIIPQSSDINPVLPVEAMGGIYDQENAARQQPKPVATADRIQTVDIIRGFALLGILLMNIPGFGFDNSGFFAMINGPRNNADFYSLTAIFTFFDGTMRGLFSMLFGAGMVLFTLNKKEVPGGATVAEYYYRRLLWLVLFGLFNAYILLWFGDILFFYGLCGMLLYPFRKVPAKWLILIGIGCICIGMFKTMTWHNETRTTRTGYLAAIAAEKKKAKLTEQQESDKTTWQQIEKRSRVDTVRVNRNLKKMHSGYTTIFTYFIPRNTEIEIWGTYHGIWDMISMMFIGMGLFALGFFSGKLSAGTYRLVLLVGYGLGIPIGYIFFSKGLLQSFNPASYIDSFSTPHDLLYDVRRVLLCSGHASLLMLIYKSKVVPWLMRAISNVGQMAFTNYLMQSIICTLIFHGYGFNQYNYLQFHQLYYVVAAVWIFQLIFSAIWLNYFRFGPFEWLWRSLTYWKKQPMWK